MTISIGIMGEHKTGEFRIPLTPRQLHDLQDNNSDLRFIVQPSEQRIFTDQEFTELGIEVSANLSDCPLVLAVKEIDIADIHGNRAYLYFSHTIKGQDYNMGMLQHILDVGATLIDYELIKNSEDQRLVFFGRHAGLAGMIDTLWTYGQLLAMDDIHSPFADIKQALEYPALPAAFESIESAMLRVPAWMEKRPALVVGITGYGNVSRGAQEILDLVPHIELTPRELVSVDLTRFQGKIIKVVFKESDMVRPVDRNAEFMLQEYFDHPDRYESNFNQYLPHLDMLVNCIYWDTPYPKLLTKEKVKIMYRSEPRLKVIGDITCDIEGAIECNLKSTTSAEPVYTYLPESDTLRMGIHSGGPVVLAVDNLPTELPREASEDFGKALLPLVPAMGRADFSADFQNLDLPSEIKGAIIAHKGKLTPEFNYLEEYLQEVGK